MAKPLRCSIVTPAGAVFDGEVTYASVPAWDGQIGVMAGQSPLLSRLDCGPLKLTSESGEQWYLLAGGFAQVQGDALTLLTEEAIPAEKLSREEAEAALAEANARVTVKGTDQRAVQADQRRALATLALIRQGRGGR